MQKLNFILLLFYFCSMDAQDFHGVNISGLERSWDTNKSSYQVESLKKDLKVAHNLGFQSVRIPIDFSKHLKKSNGRFEYSFEKKLKQIIKNSKNFYSIVLANFNHQLTDKNFKQRSMSIAQDWLHLLKKLKPLQRNITIDIANEPELSPKNWRISATSIITEIRKNYPDIKIIFGASNFNSMFELTRSKPLKIQNIIYAFHFYEPFIFTHQGTSWTGHQNSTLHLPFPVDLNAMPPLSPKAINTSGEINYNNYNKTGTYRAIYDKLKQVKDWSNQHQVEVWCTEYGVTKNADTQSRINYLIGVKNNLNHLNIPGFVWELKGNFGTLNLQLF